jgi:hypothetical protein
MAFREQRQVRLKTIFNLLQQWRALLVIGVVFTLIPFFFAVILLSVTSLTDNGVPKVDYELVSKSGKATNARITGIETQSNISINNEHPAIISYEYMGDNGTATGIYRSLDPDKIDRMNIGDTINIKHLNGSSIILGLEPFAFPFGLFTAILIPFLCIGLIVLTILIVKVRGKIGLYQSGEVRDAELVSMSTKNGRYGHARGVIVNYQYKSVRGQSLLGESYTSDLSILGSKRQGDPIKIFVSPDDDTKSCLIQKIDQLRNNWRIE